MLYVFLGIVSLLSFFTAYSDNVQIGGTMENTFRNAPHVIQSTYGVMSILCAVMVTAFVNAAASRDFASNMHQIIFTKPIDKASFLLGRFVSSTMVAIVPLLGVSIGIFMASLMPDNEPQRWGPTVWAAHLWAVIVFAVPNALLIGAIIFAIAVCTRSTMAAFVGVLLIIISYSVSGVLLRDLDNQVIAQLSDPFGNRCFAIQTRYWTVAEKNAQYVTLSGMMLWNRLLWLSIASGIFAFACVRFRFAERNKTSWFSRRKTATGQLAAQQPPTRQIMAMSSVTIPKATFHQGLSTELRQLGSQVSVDFFSTIKSNIFIVVMMFAFLNCTAALLLSVDEGFGLSSLPVTYRMIDIVRGSTYVFVISMIAFYSGVLVWKEREAHLDEVYDALPHPTWVMYTGKLISLVAIVALTTLAGMAIAVCVQAFQGYHRHQLGLFGIEFGLDMVTMFCLCVLGLISHVVSPNKYIGYFLFIILLVVNSYATYAMNIESNLLNYGTLPGYTYSDMFGFAPFTKALAWFSAYWIVTGLLASIIGVLLWRRGKETGFFRRMRMAFSRWTPQTTIVAGSVLLVWASVTSWIFYNTQQLNAYTTSEVQVTKQADFEKQFRSNHENVIPPRITEVSYTIDVYPERRALTLKGVQTLKNQSGEPMTDVYVSLTDGFEYSILIEGTTLDEEFDDFDYQIYKFDPPLAAGQSTQMSYTVSYEAVGFENKVSQLQIVQNGTFFNNQICPQIGYPKQYELTNKNDRRKHGLGEPERMPPLEPENLLARGNTYISNSSDWVDVETVISTSIDQIAVAPGSLVKEWEEGGRRYFHYKVDHPSLNFYSFISAEYEVAREKWNDVDIEVYYHADHKWNVPNMLQSIHDSLEYYSNAFGPYRHKQARIIEFPRTSTFAQAFPGTMPYSEGIGFIADISDENDIDMVYYVVAHEMAHQWWAHQVVGANMRGATLLSETLAQYSALMVMEKEYGRNMMRRFLRYEMDSYLRARGRELLREQPLKTVEASQGYIHYRKGSVVMYHLKEVMGEENVNAALRSIVDQFAYKKPPYPTSVDLINALRERCPQEAHELIDDLFERITIFANRTIDATYRELPDGKYEVTIKADCRKYISDDHGAEQEVEFTDEVEVGAFAAPEPGRKYGETLYRARVSASTGENEFTFIVDEKPTKVGVDPFSLLIDRMPGDNIKTARLVE